MSNSKSKNQIIESSMTGGYLKPINEVLEGSRYETFLKGFLVGITGFEEASIVAQNATNSIIDDAEAKLYFCLAASNGDDAPYLKNISVDEVLVQRTFTDNWQLTFKAEEHLVQAQQFEDAIYVYQNRHSLRAEGIAIKEVYIAHDSEDKLTNKWLETKVQLVLKREIKRAYQIYNFASVDCELNSMRDSIL